MSGLLLRVLHTTMIAVLATVIGCGKSEDDSPRSPLPTPDAKGFRIGVSQVNLEEPPWVQLNADIKATAEKHADLALVIKDAQDDAIRQRAHVEQFVDAGVDLIIISPTEIQPLTEPVAKAYQAGIPVIVLDRAVIGNQYTCFIGADNKRIGKAAGLWLAKKLGGKGGVVELKGLMTSTPAQDRHSGFREGLKEYPDIDVLSAPDMQWLEDNARKQMESALARFHNIDAVFAHSDPAAHGAYQAARAAGREKEILFVGIGGLPQEGVAYVAEGILDASFEYPTGGREAIDAALRVLRGEEVPRTIVLPSKYFTKENVDRGGEPIQ
ncbi:MAG: substrate-binding domain-containing protein [Pirellulales bacterium]|nr:substrate-binding domain-containing protein [Pirellulales bacterium]